MVWYRKLSRRSEHRLAMLKNMVTSLIKHDSIVTTIAKAKELRRVADWMVTHAKQGDLHHRRQANVWVQEKEMLKRLFDEAPVRFEGRAGGYTRIQRIGTRQGDAAPMARISFVEWTNSKDSELFLAKRAERQEHEEKIREEARTIYLKHKGGTHIDDVKAIARTLHKCTNRTDIKNLKAAMALVQSKVDRIRDTGAHFTPNPHPHSPHVKPTDETILNHTDGQKFTYIRRNLINKHGGRGITLPPLSS